MDRVYRSITSHPLTKIICRCVLSHTLTKVKSSSSCDRLPTLYNLCVSAPHDVRCSQCLPLISQARCPRSSWPTRRHDLSQAIMMSCSPTFTSGRSTIDVGQLIVKQLTGGLHSEQVWRELLGSSPGQLFSMCDIVSDTCVIHCHTCTSHVW